MTGRIPGILNGQSFGDICGREQSNIDYNAADELRCIHGFKLEKPCYPCQRKGDAACVFCFDFGIIVQADGSQNDCLCRLSVAE
jgi:hypothetical protein